MATARAHLVDVSLTVLVLLRDWLRPENGAFLLGGRRFRPQAMD